jgi:oligoribonuclease (3'-5' exoribonuclease)
VESTAHDLHGFVVQANNRFFGDSRIRGPYAKEHRRDIVRVRGGVLDYFVTALLDISGLRAFQESFSPRIYEKSKEKQTFKPLPIGFRMAGFRKDIG